MEIRFIGGPWDQHILDLREPLAEQMRMPGHTEPIRVGEPMTFAQAVAPDLWYRLEVPAAAEPTYVMAGPAA